MRLQKREILQPSSPCRVSVVDDQAVTEVKLALLKPRQKLLAGRKPRNERAYEIRREISSGKNKAFESILAAIFVDIDDGIPLDMATQCIQLLLTLCEQRHAERAAIQKSGILPFLPRLCRVVVRETRAQAIGDVEVTEVVANPDSAQEIREAIVALQVEESERQELVAMLTERLVEIESGR